MWTQTGELCRVLCRRHIAYQRQFRCPLPSPENSSRYTSRRRESFHKRMFVPLRPPTRRFFTAGTNYFLAPSEELIFRRTSDVHPPARTFSKTSIVHGKTVVVVVDAVIRHKKSKQLPGTAVFCGVCDISCSPGDKARPLEP